MDKLETDQKCLRFQIQQPISYNTISDPSSSTDLTTNERLNIPSHSLFQSTSINPHLFSNTDYAGQFKRQVQKLRHQLNLQQKSDQQKVDELILEEQYHKNENLRLQTKFQVELDRQEQLYKQLTESKSSLEIHEERPLNYQIKSNSKDQQQRISSSASSSSQYHLARSRTASTPPFIINQNNQH